MGDYGKLSNFNPKANFNMVRFGADTPITEYELNEAQQILDYKQKQLAKSVGDRFTKVGTMSISETLDEEGTKTLILEDNDLLVDGEPIHISTLSTPIQEGETAYLKIFEKEVSKDSEIKEYGNEQDSETLENELLDPRLAGIETARRLQTCYNIETQTTLTKEEFATENGVKELSCKNGYVDNIAIEGETLVNLALQNTTNRTNDRNRVECSNVTGITEFTVINYSSLKIRVDIFKDNEYTRFTEHSAGTNTFVQLEEGESLGAYSFIYTEESNEDTLREFKTGFVILEGDHTDKPISYFEGLKSVGQGDNIDVLTYPTNNENLITSDVTLHEDYYIPWNTGELTIWDDSNEKYYATDYIEVEPNTEYIFANINKNMAYYDANKTFIPKHLSEGYGEKKCTYFYNTSPSNAKYVRLSIKNLYIGKPYMAKGKYIWDNKAIPTTLRSLPNGVKDTIEKRGNKYVKVQRCGEVTLNGSEDWSIAAYFDNVIRFKCTLENLSFKASELQCISDLFKGDINTQWSLNYEAVDQDATFMNIRILKTKLTTQDLEGFKTWIKSNPTTVVYELATPIEVELPNFNPQIFEGNTTFIINSGAIQGECEFDVYTYHEPVFEEDITYIPLMQLHQEVEKDLRITDPNRVNYKSLNKDDNGQFTRVEVHRQNNTLKEVSELSELVDDNYTRQTITYYDELGVSVLYSEIYSLEYDEDGDLIGQELIKRC